MKKILLMTALFGSILLNDGFSANENLNGEKGGLDDSSNSNSESGVLKKFRVSDEDNKDESVKTCVPIWQICILCGENLDLSKQQNNSPIADFYAGQLGRLKLITDKFENAFFLSIVSPLSRFIRNDHSFKAIIAEMVPKSPTKEDYFLKYVFHISYDYTYKLRDSDGNFIFDTTQCSSEKLATIDQNSEAIIEKILYKNYGKAMLVKLMFAGINDWFKGAVYFIGSNKYGLDKINFQKEGDRIRVLGK